MILKVLTVTGVYYPEINGANLQARSVIQNLQSRTLVRFYVLAGYSSPNLPKISRVDGVIVARSYIRKFSLFGRLINCLRFFYYGLYLSNQVQIIHFHGFSLRNGILLFMLKLMKKAAVLKMTSLGIDDPISVRQSSYTRWALFRRFDYFIGITPAFGRAFRLSSLDFYKYRQIPNGVDMKRFSKISTTEKAKTRHRLMLPLDKVLVISVGHFSRGKNQIFAYKVWADARRRGLISKLIFIGANRNAYGVDDSIFLNIQEMASNDGFGEDLIFLEHTDTIEQYLQAADIYLSPSVFEGLSNALLEALAVGLPCIASRLPDNTTWLQERIGLLTLAKLECPEQWTQEILRSKDRFFFSSKLNYLQFSRFREEFDINKTADELLKVYTEAIRKES